MNEIPAEKSGFIDFPPALGVNLPYLTGIETCHFNFFPGTAVAHCRPGRQLGTFDFILPGVGAGAKRENNNV
ncbi:MAG: hypothetical protein KKE86_07160 [Planctomycetes bacterium]|nr:hypothetical protein [Planctomycetota bacterium]MCG2682315.1 hypothetical protein [Planctomycetales bacterium]